MRAPLVSLPHLLFSHSSARRILLFASFSDRCYDRLLGVSYALECFYNKWRVFALANASLRHSHVNCFYLYRYRTHLNIGFGCKNRHLELQIELPTYCFCCFLLSFQPDVPNWKSSILKLYVAVGRSFLLASSVHVRPFFFTIL